MNSKIKNINYAPGIPTYGIKGLIGNPGPDGNGLFYCGLNINTESDTIRNRIANKQLLSNNSYIIDNALPNNISYANGDYLLSSDGNIYQLSIVNSVISWHLIGSVFNSSFESSTVSASYSNNILTVNIEAGSDIIKKINIYSINNTTNALSTYCYFPTGANTGSVTTTYSISLDMYTYTNYIEVEFQNTINKIYYVSKNIDN